MFNKIFEILVCIIFLATVSLAIYMNKLYRISLWKVLVMVLVGAFASFAGIYLLAYFEHGYWFRWSFFGCVFCVPPAFLLLSKLIKTPYEILMDFAGPICALFFMLIKINCAVKGCCGGICIYSTADKMIYFPVQILEIIGGAIILLLLLLMQKSSAKRGRLASVFLIMFGLLRFSLSFLREGIVYLRFLKDVGIYIPATRLWPLVCIVWGLIWMHRIVSKEKGQRAGLKECGKAIVDMFRFNKEEKERHA